MTFSNRAWQYSTRILIILSIISNNTDTNPADWTALDCVDGFDCGLTYRISYGGNGDNVAHTFECCNEE